MKHSRASLPLPLRNSRASGSVVEACVSLLRRSPWKSRLVLRPPPGGSSRSSLDRKLFKDAHASTRGAVDREVLAAQELPDPRVVQDRCQQLGRDLTIEQAVAVGRERG